MTTNVVAMPVLSQLQSTRAWVLAWQPHEPVPEAVVPTLGPCLAAARTALTPAGERELASLVRALVGFGKAFAIPVPEPKALSAIYAATLRDVPSDLLAVAVERVMAGHKFGMRLPLPGEIRAEIAEELAARKLTMLRLELAIARAPKPEPAGPPVSPETRAQVVAMVQAFAASMRVDLPPEPREIPEDVGRKQALSLLGIHRERLQTIRAECLGDVATPSPAPPEDQ